MMELHNIKINTGGSSDFINVTESRFGASSEEPIMIGEIFDLLSDQDALMSNIRQLRAVIEKEGRSPKTN